MTAVSATPAANCGHNRPEETPITQAYLARTRRSAALASEAQRSLPSGIAHDSRRLLPHAVHIERAQGAEKWDADGNAYVDDFGGHGSLSGAAGVTALRMIGETDACERASCLAARMREGLNEVLARTGTPWAAYGQSSVLHIFMSERGRAIDPKGLDPLSVPRAELLARPADALRLLRLALLVNGVDIGGLPGRLASAARQERDITLAIEAFTESLAMLRRADVLG